MVKLTFDEERVPLREVEEGDVRVGNTKVALEGIIARYLQGYTPEEIQSSYDVVSLGDVYSVIGYYLHRKEEVDQYIQESNEEYDRLVEEYKSQPGARAYYARLEEFRRQKESERQVAKEPE